MKDYILENINRYQTTLNKYKCLQNLILNQNISLLISQLSYLSLQIGIKKFLNPCCLTTASNLAPCTYLTITFVLTSSACCKLNPNESS